MHITRARIGVLCKIFRRRLQATDCAARIASHRERCASATCKEMISHRAPRELFQLAYRRRYLRQKLPRSPEIARWIPINTPGDSEPRVRLFKLMKEKLDKTKVRAPSISKEALLAVWYRTTRPRATCSIHGQLSLHGLLAVMLVLLLQTRSEIGYSRCGVYLL